MPLFDAYIFIDWSAANRSTPRNPSADAVWMGQLVRHHCLEEGVSKFVAEVLLENKAMLAVFARSGHPMKQSFEEGVIYVTLSLLTHTP